jgi:hypothetical protein
MAIARCAGPEPKGSKCNHLFQAACPLDDLRGHIIANLTPGTMYTFQVRALGLLGYTNWSDPVNRICT